MWLLVVLGIASQPWPLASDPDPTTAITPSETSLPTGTAPGTPTPSPDVTPTVTATPSPAPTPSITPTPSIEPKPSASPTQSPTPTIDHEEIAKREQARQTFFVIVLCSLVVVMSIAVLILCIHMRRKIDEENNPAYTKAIYGDDAFEFSQLEII